MSNIANALRNLADQIESTSVKMQNSRHKDRVDDSTIIINALKKIGVPFHVGQRMVAEHAPQYIARKIFLYEYRQAFAKSSPRDAIRFIQAAIKNDYYESDDFLNWVKRKKQAIGNDITVEYRRLLNLI
jgi:hypothetical protein